MTTDEKDYVKLYDMKEVDMTNVGKKIYSNIKKYLDNEISGLIKEHEIDPLELSYLITTYANEQCMMVARENKMNRDIEESVENAEEKIIPDIPSN